MTPKARAIQAKINKGYYIKLKSLCMPKDTTNKIKRQPTEGEKILANFISDEGLTSKIRSPYNSKATNKQTKITYNYNMGRGTEKPFFQRRHTNGQQIHKKVLNSTDHQENAIKMHNELSPHTC